MKKTVFYSLPFDCHDIAPSFEGKCHRIQAGNKTFYTYKSQFNNIDVLEKLQAGDKLFIGAHQLIDGTYWLHWLISPEKGDLKPNLMKRNKFSSFLKILIALILLYFSVYAFIEFNDVFSIGFTSVIFIVFAVWLLISGFHSLLASTIRSMRRLLRGFEQVKAGNISICQPILLSLASTDSESPVLQELDELSNDLDSVRMKDLEYFDEITIITVKGTATNIRTRRDSVGSGKYRRECINYQFTCNNMQCYWRSFYNELTKGLNPIFFRKHPFFIAPHDPVTLLVNQKAGVIEGFYNQKDSSAYLKIMAFFISFEQMKLAYKVNCFIMLITMSLLTSFAIYDLWKLNQELTKWDWIHFAEKFYSMGLMTLMICSSFMLILEISAFILRKYSSSAARINYIRQNLITLKINSGKKIYIQEEV
ncbi:TPA: hypothetical protein ACS70H_003471 [Providencia alcalifaciens]